MASVSYNLETFDGLTVAEVESSPVYDDRQTVIAIDCVICLESDFAEGGAE